MRLREEGSNPPKTLSKKQEGTTLLHSAAKPQPKGIHRRDAENSEFLGCRSFSSLRVSAVNFLLPPYKCAAKKAEYAEKTFARKQETRH